jgi:hypothetical protein
VQVSSLGALRRHCRLDITDFGIWAKSPVPRTPTKKLSGSPFRCRSCCVPWNSNLCGNSGSLGVTTLHVLQKNTSRQLNKSRFSTLIRTNLRQLFHERVFFFSSFYLPSRHVCRTLSSRCFVVPAKRSVIWSTPSPLRRTAAPRTPLVPGQSNPILLHLVGPFFCGKISFYGGNFSVSLLFCVFATFSGSFFVLCRHLILEIITFYFVNPPPVIIICVCVVG